MGGPDLSSQCKSGSCDASQSREWVSCQEQMDDAMANVIRDEKAQEEKDVR